MIREASHELVPGIRWVVKIVYGSHIDVNKYKDKMGSYLEVNVDEEKRKIRMINRKVLITTRRKTSTAFILFFTYPGCHSARPSVAVGVATAST